MNPFFFLSHTKDKNKIARNIINQETTDKNINKILTEIDMKKWQIDKLKK